MNQARAPVYVLLIVTAVGAAAGRIAHVELLFEPSFYPTPGGTQWPANKPKPMPTLSSNDRSRWCAVRSVVDHRTWVIGRRVTNPDGGYRDEGIVFEEGWRTVDKVLKPGTGEFYSSKPPLLTALVAIEYWLLKQLFGWEITTNTNYVVRTILITFNVLPFAAYLWMLKSLIDRFASSDWARLFVFVAACFGTFLGTFAITLNNHTIAAVTALATVFPWLKQQLEERLILGLPVPAAPSPSGAVVSGIFAGLTACLELPATALLAAVFAIYFLRAPWRTLAFFVPAAAIPICAQLALNYLAVGQWAPVYAKVDSEWYRYDGSHWKIAEDQIKHGIDWAWQHESRSAYAFHLLIGHHGLFSLSPIWLLAFAGLWIETTRWFRRTAATTGIPRVFAPMVLAVSVVVIGFYLVKSNNYGGMTSCLRWLLWLAPFWLVAITPLADWLAKRRWTRWLAYFCLAISVFSAAYPSWNPWRHPWLYDFLEKLGAIRY